MKADRIWPPFQSFGDGSDGDVTAVSGALTRNMYYNTLIIPNAVTLDSDHFIIFSKVSVTIQSGGKLWVAPNNGGNASGATAGAAGVQDQAAAKPLGRMFAGIIGRTGVTGAGVTGVAFTTAHEGETNGGGNGAGGASGAGVAAAGSASPAATAETTFLWRRVNPYILRSITKPGSNIYGPCGGGGGASGGGDNATKKGGGGGGGGSSGGYVMIWSPLIQLDSGGEISVTGGIGGNGGNGEGAGGATGGGGGGAGGGAGNIFLFCNRFLSNGTVTLTGGGGGSLGTGSSGGGNGSNGNSGGTGRLIVYNLMSGTWSVT